VYHTRRGLWTSCLVFPSLARRIRIRYIQHVHNGFVEGEGEAVHTVRAAHRSRVQARSIDIFMRVYPDEASIHRLTAKT
jgi:hypothetical protein